MADIDFKSLKALVVEDNDFVRFMVKKHLSDFGFAEVFEAVNGDEGFLLLQRSPDIVVCDIGMSPGDGFTFLKKLRADERTRLLPVIFLTAHAEQATVQKAVNEKVDAYILKPVTPDALRRKIVQLLTRETN